MTGSREYRLLEIISGMEYCLLDRFWVEGSRDQSLVLFLFLFLRVDSMSRTVLDVWGCRGETEKLSHNPAFKASIDWEFANGGHQPSPCHVSSWDASFTKPTLSQQPAQQVPLAPFPGEETEVSDLGGYALVFHLLDFPPWVFLPEQILSIIEVRTCCQSTSRKWFQEHDWDWSQTAGCWRQGGHGGR